jgi:ABC-type branched-subunit amino acid transport system permease subunit
VRLPPLLSQHPWPVQVSLAVVVPAVYGAITGYFLGTSEGVYLVLSAIGILGGIGAGLDHAGAWAGAKRGVVAGSVFGTSILIAHEIHGADAKTDLPDPAILLVAITTLLAIAFAALGGWIRLRVIRKGEVDLGPEVPGPLG